MGKIVALVYLSLDGVMESPSWTAPYFDEEHGAYAHRRLFAADALLLGRETYEGFVQAWPGMTDEDGFADRMNSMPKHVASTTLRTTEWNATLIDGDLAQEVAALKERYENDILIYGSGALIRSLIAEGLVDELKLWIHPVVVGKGKRLFPEGAPASTWVPAGTTTFTSGAMVLDYRPAGQE
ncbi:dihydrofolate reductase family protein [Streptomyces sp. SCA3-4]|uniref:dihydrofolate reductase family protein n=1 Tax=Streptomyces sichuanensis TaxID=2871810 RepID=UPI001CE237EB|nr:dihydrofolate reductase family protein [Streptomyces sichuanensis]MCA6092397.1 dihydrofolate reductase family protein [Streptomyces sichuanensis]